MKIFRNNSVLVLLLSILCMLVVSSGCRKRTPPPQTDSKPKTFIKTMEPSWISIALRDGVTEDQAWDAILDILIKRFDMEVMEKNNGYIRTVWLYTWTGQATEDYRVRTTVKFKKGEKKVDIKTEAEYNSGEQWVAGYDTRLVETLKTDIMGSVGRTTR